MLLLAAFYVGACAGPSETCATTAEIELVQSLARENEWLLNDVASQVSTSELAAAREAVDSADRAITRWVNSCVATYNVSSVTCLGQMPGELERAAIQAQAEASRRQRIVRDSVKARLQYRVEEIVLRSRNQTTHAPSCRGMLVAYLDQLPEASGAAGATVRAEIEYTMERTSDGRLLGTLEWVEGVE